MGPDPMDPRDPMNDPADALRDPMNAMVEAMVSMHELFLNAMRGGFTETQALHLIATLLMSGKR